MNRRATRRTVAIALCLCLGITLLVVACGAPDVTGVYKSTGGGVLAAGTTMTINEDGTFTASGTAPVVNTPFEVEGKWTQDGAEVTLTAEGPFAELIGTRTGTYEDGSLVFGEEVWEKQ